MNIHEYISSGILEAYALGELSEKERGEVEENLARYPALREELSLIEEAQEKLLMRAAIKPRSVLKDRLLKKLEVDKTEAKVVSMPRRSLANPWKYAAAAAAAIALIASYLAYDYRSQLAETKSQLAEVQATNQRIAEQYDQVNQRLDQIETDLSITSNPEFERVAMSSAPGAPEGSLATVYWNPKTREVYLDIQQLEQISKDSQFQLWAIVDNKPVDAGVFDANVTGLIKMKKIGAGAAMFAVTIEPRGGLASPTLSTMQVAGKVTV